MNVTLPLPLLCCMFFLFPDLRRSIGATETYGASHHSWSSPVWTSTCCGVQGYSVQCRGPQTVRYMVVFFPMARWRLVSRKKDVPQNAICWFGKWSNLVSQTWCNPPPSWCLWAVWLVPLTCRAHALWQTTLLLPTSNGRRDCFYL